jgi:hypothetical protein
MRRAPATDFPILPDAVVRHTRYERTPLRAPVRVIYDSASGLHSLTGQLVGLTETGCALHLYVAFDTAVAALMLIDLDAGALGLPIVTRWRQPVREGWRLGADFDGLTPEKRAKLRRIIKRQPTRSQ